ncbi:helix-turn-helix transcriptional regulator [Bifidobacterium sp. UTBIF-78]|uniref:helix-turn-helix domain-containing protein n=1 Tax=Bifidobacterium sp. UTBIF-78 TaxID=1465263 RepID=UPI0021599B53|nr:helix-turn-helix transcriptional regulator [Bifidobacterium sp. UTBIF-78]
MFDKSNIGAAMGRMSSAIRSIRQLTVALRDARVTQKLTQEELSRRTGLTRSWISQFEQGRIENASISRILLLCRELGVSFTVSYDVPGQPPATPNQAAAAHGTRPPDESDGPGALHPVAHVPSPSSDEISRMAQRLQPLAGFSMETYFNALRKLTTPHVEGNDDRKRHRR